MKVILDTNIFLGACIGHGDANRLVMQCLKGQYRPLMGSTLLAEYEDVLNRHHLFSKSRLNEAERDELLDIFLSHCEWTRIYYTWRPNLKDEGDNHLIELAIAGNARYVVTYNLRDFRQTELKFPEIEICTPNTLLEKN